MFAGAESSSRRFLEIRAEDLPDEVPTVGSVGHPESCKPCFYMFNKKGCHFGRSCLYCHMDHVKKKKERPPKMVRQECRELANQVFRDAATASSGAASSSNLEAKSPRTTPRRSCGHWAATIRSPRRMLVAPDLRVNEMKVLDVR
eukprot:s914_g1.t1